MGLSPKSGAALTVTQSLLGISSLPLSLIFPHSHTAMCTCSLSTPFQNKHFFKKEFDFFHYPIYSLFIPNRLGPAQQKGHLFVKHSGCCLCAPGKRGTNLELLDDQGVLLKERKRCEKQGEPNGWNTPRQNKLRATILSKNILFPILQLCPNFCCFH